MPATWLEHAEREWRGIDVEVEGERFVAWNRAQGKVSADWFATWQLWLEHVRGGERRSPDEDVVETGERAKAHPIDPEWGTVRDALQAECGADAVYDRHSYDTEKRHALDLWGSYVERIIAGKPAPSNVVELTQTAL